MAVSDDAAEREYALHHQQHEIENDKESAVNSFAECHAVESNKIPASLLLGL
jgi:hypothetical protein